VTQPLFVIIFQTLHVSMKPIIIRCLFIQKLRIEGKNVILRDLTSDMKYKLPRLVILDGVSFNTNCVVYNLKRKILKI
jgi:hypothetical protein